MALPVPAGNTGPKTLAELVPPVLICCAPSGREHVGFLFGAHWRGSLYLRCGDETRIRDRDIFDG